MSLGLWSVIKFPCEIVFDFGSSFPFSFLQKIVKFLLRLESDLEAIAPFFSLTNNQIVSNSRKSNDRKTIKIPFPTHRVVSSQLVSFHVFYYCRTYVSFPKIEKKGKSWLETWWKSSENLLIRSKLKLCKRKKSFKTKIFKVFSLMKKFFCWLFFNQVKSDSFELSIWDPPVDDSRKLCRRFNHFLQQRLISWKKSLLKNHRQVKFFFSFSLFESKKRRKLWWLAQKDTKINNITTTKWTKVTHKKGQNKEDEGKHPNNIKWKRIRLQWK